MSPGPSKLDAVLERPGRAIAALGTGLLVGFTVAIAFGAGGDDAGTSQRAATTTVKATRTSQGGRQPTPKPKPKPTTAPENKPKPAQRPQSLAAARASVERVIAAAGVPAGVAIQPLYGDEPLIAGDTGEYQAWSALKIPVIAAYLENFPQPDAKAQAHITQAIEQSSNEDVRALYQQMITKLGGVQGANAALQSTLQEGGAQISGLPDRIDPTINSVAFGESRWTPVDAARFLQFLARGCLGLSEANARLILTHMNNISNGRWGVLTTYPADRTFAKGGWGSGAEGWTVSQTAIIGRGQDGLALAMMSRPASYESGQALMSRIAKALRRGGGTPSRGLRLPTMDCPR